MHYPLILAFWVVSACKASEPTKQRKTEVANTDPEVSLTKIRTLIDEICACKGDNDCVNRLRMRAGQEELLSQLGALKSNESVEAQKLVAKLTLCMADKVAEMKQYSERSMATLNVTRLAFEAYPQWLLNQTEATCPENLSEILKYTKVDEADPWGEPYIMLCDDAVPSDSENKFVVISKGPDKQQGTIDDLSSISD